jgi:hypothetical protein
VYWSAVVMALVPAGVPTNTFTLPAACAGAVTVSFDEDTSVDGSADPAAPNFTVAPGTNPLPVIVTVFVPAADPPVGLTPETTGAPNAYRSLFVGALGPAAVVTNTCTVLAACAGATTVSFDGDTNVDESADPSAPNFTVAPGTNPLPVIVTVFPPAVDPPLRLTPETTGAPNAYRSLFVRALGPAPVVTNTSTVPAACAGATTVSFDEDTNVAGRAEPAGPNVTVAPGTNPLPVIVTVFAPAVGPPLRLTPETTGAPNAYRSLFVGALVPAAVVTRTWTVPAACAGAVTVSCEEDTNVAGRADPAEPNVTVAPGTNPLPVIVTVFAPASGPPVGLTPETTGAPNAYRSLFVCALVPPPVVTNTSTVPAACAGAVTVSCDEDTNVAGSADPAEPNVTVAPGTNPLPVIVTVFAPATGPPPGLTAVTVGGPTVSVALAVLPVPPLIEETVALLLQSPAVVPVALTTTWQLELAAIDPPLSEIEPDPAVAVAVPPQVLLSPFGVATTNPDGSVSVNATPDSATVFADGLVIVNVNDVVRFNGSAAAPNA